MKNDQKVLKINIRASYNSGNTVVVIFIGNVVRIMGNKTRVSLQNDRFQKTVKKFEDPLTRLIDGALLCARRLNIEKIRQMITNLKNVFYQRFKKLTMPARYSFECINVYTKVC